MKSIISQYKTYAENKKRNCGEASLIFAMLEIPIPCSHLVFLNEITIHESKWIQTDQNYFNKIRKHAVKTIKRFSHYPNKAEINQYVKNKLPFNKEPENFELGYPIEAIAVINDCILFFFKKQKH